jgi:hypothetical protein
MPIRKELATIIDLETGAWVIPVHQISIAKTVSAQLRRELICLNAGGRNLMIGKRAGTAVLWP